ncbi:MAG: 3'-5' exonuclease domain-containing protein 2 [Puniceicoccales bacterium]|jgi:ribonuclease D|nr:3'-5' exonuclease domain-containing protein 2 [Puniceicoccales bacterium]
MEKRIFSFWANILRTLKILPTYPSKISKETLQSLPLRTYDGPIHFIDNEGNAQKAVRRIMGESILGFDTESKPAFLRGEKYLPSIVQIATANEVYLFQLAKLKKLHALKPIFESQNLIKAGIAIRDDVLKLQEIENFNAAKFQDIGTLAQSLGIEQTGMRNLAGIFLKCRISKASQVTDWSQENLSAKQLTYAATDAWISRILYLEVKKHIP